MWVLSFWFFWNITHWAETSVHNDWTPYSPGQCDVATPTYSITSSWTSRLSSTYKWCQYRERDTPNYSDQYNYYPYINIDINASKCTLRNGYQTYMKSDGKCDWWFADRDGKLEFNKVFEYEEDIKAKACYRANQLRVRGNHWGRELNPNPRDSYSCWSEITFDSRTHTNKLKDYISYETKIKSDEWWKRDCSILLPSSYDFWKKQHVIGLLETYKNFVYRPGLDKNEIDRIHNNIKRICSNANTLIYWTNIPTVSWNDVEIVVVKWQPLTREKFLEGITITDNVSWYTREEQDRKIRTSGLESFHTNSPWTWTVQSSYKSLKNDIIYFNRNVKVIELNLSQLTPLLAPLPNADKLINDSNKTNYDNLINQWKNLSATTQTEVDDLVDKIQKAKAKLRFDTTAPTLTFDTLTPSIKVGETFDKFAWLTTTDNIDTTTSQTDWNNKTTVTSSPTLNTNQVGTYTLTYKVKDNHNNQATITRTLTVNPVNKTQLTTNLNNLRDKLNDSKVVRNNKYNEANTWYQANKNKPTDQNLSQTEVTTLENKANQLLNALVSDTVAPTIAYTYSANFQQFAQLPFISTTNENYDPFEDYLMVSFKNNEKCNWSVYVSANWNLHRVNKDIDVHTLFIRKTEIENEDGDGKVYERVFIRVYWENSKYYDIPINYSN